MGPSPLWLLLAMIPMAASVPQVNIDLAVIAYTHVQQWDEEFNAIKKAVVEIFPTVFEMGPGKSRVGMVYKNIELGVSNQRWWIKTSLCENNDDLISNISHISAGTDARATAEYSLLAAIGAAFQTIKLDTGTPSQNRRVVLMVTYLAGVPVNFQQDEKEFLQDAIQTYPFDAFAVYQMRNNEQDQRSGLGDVIRHAEDFYTTDSIARDFNTTVFQWLKDKLIGVSLCGYEERCFFQDAERQQCKMVWYTPNMTVDDGDCEATYNRPAPIASNKECNVTECAETCDDLWAKVKCGDDGCGKTMIQTPKRWVQLEHCDREIELKCPACTTTTTTTTPIATTTAPPTPTPTATPTPPPTQPANGVRAQYKTALIIAAVVIVMIAMIGCGGEEE